jgi:hypothetical protein
MTKPTTRQRFVLFVTRAAELEELRLFKQGMRAEYILSWKASDGKLVHTSKEPDEEDLRSYLLSFRKFISKDESIFINKIFNDCELSLSDRAIIAELRQARDEWKKSLKNVGGLQVTVNGRSLTSEYVLDLWINGHYFHDDLEKAAKLEELAKGQILFTRMQLFGALPNLTGIILGVGQGIKKCLNANKFTFWDEIGSKKNEKKNP